MFISSSKNKMSNVISRHKYLGFDHNKCSGINITNPLTHQCRRLWIIITTTMRTYNNARADRRWARCKQWTRDRGPMHWPREQRTWVMQSTTGSTTPDVIQAINPPDTACFVYTSFFHRRYRHSDNKVLNVPLHIGPFCLIVFCYLNGF